MNVDATLELINPSVRSLKAYHLNPQDVEVKLNQNENPFDWPPEIKHEVAAFCESRPWNRYPDFIPAALKQALADYAGVQPDAIMVGNGSNEMLLVLLLALTGPDRPLITCQPTFTVYRLIAAGLGRDQEPVYLTPDFRFDTDALREALGRKPRAVVMLCSPNNPTGSVLSEEQLRAILDFHQGFCIVDQAYVEFGGFNAMPLLAEYPNLVVTRTFSKAFAAAGLRLGYMAGRAEVMAEINKVKLPYNINFFSDHVANVLLSHRDIIGQRVSHIVRERERVYAFLSSLGRVRAYESNANFILIRVEDKDALFAALGRSQILVRDVSAYPMLQNCLRISIGTAEENDRLMKGIARHYGASA